MITDQSIRWIENLAEQDAVSSIDISSTKGEILELGTRSFLTELASHLSTMARLFNRRVNSDGHLGFSKSKLETAGVILSRREYRLMVSTSQPGLIQLQCASYPSGSLLFSGLVEARFEAFHRILWYSLGNPVSAEEVARYHLTEFIQTSKANS